MNPARQSDAVSWWVMGKNATRRYGFEHARDIAADISNLVVRRYFMAGAMGEPRPRVRPTKKENADV